MSNGGGSKKGADAAGIPADRSHAIQCTSRSGRGICAYDVTTQSIRWTTSDAGDAGTDTRKRASLRRAGMADFFIQDSMPEELKRCKESACTAQQAHGGGERSNGEEQAQSTGSKGAVDDADLARRPCACPTAAALEKAPTQQGSLQIDRAELAIQCTSRSSRRICASNVEDIRCRRCRSRKAEARIKRRVK